MMLIMYVIVALGGGREGLLGRRKWCWPCRVQDVMAAGCVEGGVSAGTS